MVKRWPWVIPSKPKAASQTGWRGFWERNYHLPPKYRTLCFTFTNTYKCTCAYLTSKLLITTSARLQKSVLPQQTVHLKSYISRRKERHIWSHYLWRWCRKTKKCGSFRWYALSPYINKNHRKWKVTPSLKSYIVICIVHKAFIERNEFNAILNVCCSQGFTAE